MAGGDDQFAAVGNPAALIAIDVNGGADNDNLHGGNGPDTLDGGPGADFVDGNQGVDTMLLGDGDDVAQWDPGDGNDLVDGGPGADRMAFNGSNIGELINVTDNAGRVRVTRNIGTITLELDNTETLDVTAVGGPDTITVNNLAGTDLTTLNTNLAASGGGDAPDGVADSIIVNGTVGDDTIDIVADEADVVVLGLAHGANRPRRPDG